MATDESDKVVLTLHEKGLELEKVVLTLHEDGNSKTPREPSGKSDGGISGAHSDTPSNGFSDDPEGQLAARAQELRPDVTRLVVEMRGFSSLTHAGIGFGQALANLKMLRTLELHMGNCQQLISVGKLGEGLAQLNALDALTLDFCECCSLETLEELGQELTHLSGLQKLVLDFRNCKGLKSIDKLETGLACLQRLNSLTLNFYCCTALTSVGGLAKGFAQLTAMHSLHVDLGGCEALQSIEELGRSISHLKSLNELFLVLAGCQGLAHIEKLGEGLAGLRTLRHGKLFLDLGSVVHLSPALARSFHSVDDFLEVQRSVLAAAVAAQTTIEIIQGMHTHDVSTTIGSSHGTPGHSASLSDIWEIDGEQELQE